MTDVELMKGAAVLLAEKLLPNGQTTGSITVGFQKDEHDPVRYVRLIVREISEKDVEHNQG